MSDTLNDIRTAIDKLEMLTLDEGQLLTNLEFDRQAICEAVDMLERYAELLEHMDTAPTIRLLKAKLKRSAGEWVPVTERLPPGTDDYAVRIVGREEYDYVLVLVQSVLGGKPFVAAGAYHLGEWHCNGPDVVDVTHWLDVKLPGGE